MSLSLEGLHEVISKDALPRQVEGFEFERIPCCFLLRESGTDNVIKLNETGVLIWELCDGNLTVGEIIDGLQAQYPEADSIEKDVNRAIGELVEEGVVVLGQAG